MLPKVDDLLLYLSLLSVGANGLIEGTVLVPFSFNLDVRTDYYGSNSEACATHDSKNLDLVYNFYKGITECFTLVLWHWKNDW